ncbi:MAG: fibronectin type III domain-containing protein [Thermoplasmatota archaeon]
MAALIIPMLTTADEAGNDSFENAEEITEGTHTGSLDQTDELDYYKILLDPSTIISITFSSQTENDQKLILCDPTQEERFDLRSSLEVEETDVFYLANETVRDHWFIKVDSFWSDKGHYSFRVDLDLQDDAGSGGDVNEDHSGAYEIDPGVELNGTLADLDEVDMYKIEIDPGSIVEVSFSSGSEMDQKLQFMNPNKEVKIDLRSSMEAEETDIFYLANETVRDHWFVKVERYYSDHGSYSFKVDLDLQDDAGSGKDVSGDHSEAFQIDTNIEFNGIVGDLDEMDMYKVELEPGSMVKINFTCNAENDQKLRFMDPTKDEIFSLSSSEGVMENDVFYLANETVRDHWFVKVERHYSDHGSYSFKVDLDLQDDAGSGGDVSSEYDDPYEIEHNLAYEGVLGYLDEVDIYSIFIDKDTEVTVNFTAEPEDGFDLELLDPGRSEELSIRSSRGSEESGTIEYGNGIEAGYWYIKIETWSGVSGQYSLETHIVTTDGPSPVEISGSSVTDSSVTISWTESDDPDFDRYEIYMSSSAGDVGELAGTIDSRGTTSHEVTDLDPDTTYFIRVNAVSKDGGSVMSDQVSVSTEDEDEKEGPALVFIICGVVLVLLIIVLVFVAVIFIVVKAVSGSKKDEE